MTNDGLEIGGTFSIIENGKVVEQKRNKFYKDYKKRIFSSLKPSERTTTNGSAFEYYDIKKMLEDGVITSQHHITIRSPYPYQECFKDYVVKNKFEIVGPNQQEFPRATVYQIESQVNQTITLSTINSIGNDGYIFADVFEAAIANNDNYYEGYSYFMIFHDENFEEQLDISTILNPARLIAKKIIPCFRKHGTMFSIVPLFSNNTPDYNVSSRFITIGRMCTGQTISLELMAYIDWGEGNEQNFYYKRSTNEKRFPNYDIKVKQPDAIYFNTTLMTDSGKEITIKDNYIQPKLNVEQFFGFGWPSEVETIYYFYDLNLNPLDNSITIYWKQPPFTSRTPERLKTLIEEVKQQYGDGIMVLIRENIKTDVLITIENESPRISELHQQNYGLDVISGTYMVDEFKLKLTTNFKDIIMIPPIKLKLTMAEGEW